MKEWNIWNKTGYVAVVIIVATLCQYLHLVMSPLSHDFVILFAVF